MIIGYKAMSTVIYRMVGGILCMIYMKTILNLFFRLLFIGTLPGVHEISSTFNPNLPFYKLFISKDNTQRSKIKETSSSSLRLNILSDRERERERQKNIDTERQRRIERKREMKRPSAIIQ